MAFPTFICSCRCSSTIPLRNGERFANEFELLLSLFGEEDVLSNVSSMVDSNNISVLAVVMQCEGDDNGDDDERFGVRRILEYTSVGAKLLTGSTTENAAAHATTYRRDFICRLIITYKK